SLIKPESNRKDHTMDDRKLNELLNKALAFLTEEQKEKAKACKTAKELLDYLSAEGVELPDEALDKVSGGKDDPSTTLTEFRRY
ncbi:MAG: hypothetical protein II474_02730, partial [Firmicutes bacterium]|nr:hypothetical protein [Bacillota bacterium]